MGRFGRLVISGWAFLIIAFFCEPANAVVYSLHGIKSVQVQVAISDKSVLISKEFVSDYITQRLRRANLYEAKSRYDLTVVIASTDYRSITQREDYLVNIQLRLKRIIPVEGQSFEWLEGVYWEDEYVELVPAGAVRQKVRDFLEKAMDDLITQMLAAAEKKKHGSHTTSKGKSQ